MRIVSLLTPCTLSLKELQRETPCTCEVAWPFLFPNTNRLLLLGNSRHCMNLQQLAVVYLCHLPAKFELQMALKESYGWRRCLGHSAPSSYFCAASNSCIILQPGLAPGLIRVTISQVIIVTALSLQAFCTKCRPSLGALVGCRIVMLILMNLWSLHPFWAEALMKESSLPSLSQSGGAPHLGPRGVSWFVEFQDQGHSPDPPSTYGCQQWCLFWMKHEPLPALREK